MTRRGLIALLLSSAAATAAALPARAGTGGCRPTGALGLVVERATGSLLVVDRMARDAIGRIEGLGDLSHASIVYSPDERFAYVFGRDGGLTKVDMLAQCIAKRVIQGGNSIGGAISDDGALVAVSNYEPGGIRIFDAGTLEMVLDLSTGSKTIGLVDAPGRRFVFSLWDRGETWIADLSDKEPRLLKLMDIGKNPYDGLITGDGRTYIAGLFGEDGLAMVDLWQDPPHARRILPHYGRGAEKMPVYKMPHLEGWALAGEQFVLPEVGHHEVIWMDARSFQEVARTKTHGQPVFAMARPGGRQVWVNFAHPLNDTLQVIDSLSHEIVHQIKPGPAVLHMEFDPRGAEVWVSVRDAGKVVIYDTETFAVKGEIAARSPSGIFFTARAHRIGL